MTRRNVTYDPNNAILSLDDRDVSVSRGSYEGDRSTFIWELHHSTCVTSLQQIYRGTATIVTPSNEDLDKQAIVKDVESGITFALLLTKEKDLCGVTLFQSQLSNIYLAITKDSYIYEAAETTKVPRLDNIIG